eukprot:1934528-Pyramimonas_sp.AAC.1
MTIAAVGIVGVPFGLIASGFTDVLEDHRKQVCARELNLLGNAFDDRYDPAGIFPAVGPGIAPQRAGSPQMDQS